MKPILEVRHISKKYRINHQTVGYASLRERIQRAFRFERSNIEDFFALQDVSFDVQAGESIGIIGRNGAGKSTLLKILSRITLPSKGKILTRGRIASLLEVGTGFHPELTGRENIFFNGSLLGMKRKEIETKFDEIVDFSGVEKFLDTPLKHYSSGMQLRLAFAVAAFLEPEILVIDEVLAVGDAEFQRKCLGKMEDVSRSGRTILFVSHNMASLRKLCEKAIWLDKGIVISEGPIAQILNAYSKNEVINLDSQWVNAFDDGQTIVLENVRVTDQAQHRRNEFLSSEDIYVHMQVQSKEIFDHVKVGFDLIKNNDVVFRTQQVDFRLASKFDIGSYSLSCRIPKDLLNEGTYIIKPLFSIHCVKSLITHDGNAALFKVRIDTSRSEYHSILNENNHPGYVFPLLEWHSKKVDFKQTV
ncbi:MAG TPA: ABC transporter ATP-binding protein [Chryseosolibacter sp.]